MAQTRRELQMRRVPRNLKSDESFVEKISMGATGGRRVCDDLARQGHRPLELERGALSCKIWRGIKLKRLRVPDILCVSCGVRVEARAKTSLEISMSHSRTDPERGWDYGLAAGDYIAFVLCEKSGPEPVDWRARDLVQYVRVADLREAQHAGNVVVTEPKGREEGFETRLQWPVAVANYPGTVSSVTGDRIVYQRHSDGRAIPLKIVRAGVRIGSMVRVGDQVDEGQVLAAPVPVCRAIRCDSNLEPDDYIDQLQSPDLHDRYAAAKALSILWSDRAGPALERMVRETREEAIVRLEAAATLMKHGMRVGQDFITDVLATSYDAERLEAVVVLAEVGSEDATRLLTTILLDAAQHPDVRAGAAWALGEIGHSVAIPSLVQVFGALDAGLRADAARALSSIGHRHPDRVAAELPDAGSDARAGIAWALAHLTTLDVAGLLDQAVDEEARRWAAYVIGSHDQGNLVAVELQHLRDSDPEIYFAATVLWQVATSWVNGLEAY